MASRLTVPPTSSRGSSRSSSPGRTPKKVSTQVRKIPLRLNHSFVVCHGLKQFIASFLSSNVIGYTFYLPCSLTILSGWKKSFGVGVMDQMRGSDSSGGVSIKVEGFRWRVQRTIAVRKFVCSNFGCSLLSGPMFRMTIVKLSCFVKNLLYGKYIYR